ncbi:DEAD/DEAH box helicase [Pseudobdellovibrio sp. HCB154]|uniref:DEAD/DEAH box helicase n=1 Tax=Pseudobdellovibrio sp. HCB154 TaxID=3386277 RepID=UPI00391741E1
MKFDKLQLSEDLLRNLLDMKYFRTTDIQYKTIPAVLRGEDVLAIAQTGTGKTAAFAIPIIDIIHSSKSSKRSGGIRCLVMVPTRELAQQIGEVFNNLSRHMRCKSFALYGGVEQDRQIKKLEDGLDVLIATPGRMFDLISQGHIDLSGIEILVLDEADQMLDLGFIEDIESIKRKLTRGHQTLFFSATINTKIKRLAYNQVRHNAIRIQISPEDPVSKNISHAVINIPMDDKRFFLADYVKQNPEGKFVVFVRTRIRAERVAKAMERMEVKTLTLHGEKDQTDRLQVMQAFRSGECKVLIATDITARGIDIPDVTHVINYDIPEKAENYVHRIGRTGRGFNKGLAVSFCAPEEKELLLDIEDLIGKQIDVLKVSKKAYEMVLTPPSEDMNFAELIAHEESVMGKPKKGFKNKKK